MRRTSAGSSECRASSRCRGATRPLHAAWNPSISTRRRRARRVSASISVSTSFGSAAAVSGRVRPFWRIAPERNRSAVPTTPIWSAPSKNARQGGKLLNAFIRSSVAVSAAHDRAQDECREDAAVPGAAPTRRIPAIRGEWSRWARRRRAGRPGSAATRRRSIVAAMQRLVRASCASSRRALLCGPHSSFHDLTGCVPCLRRDPCPRSPRRPRCSVRCSPEPFRPPRSRGPPAPSPSTRRCCPASTGATSAPIAAAAPSPSRGVRGQPEVAYFGAVGGGLWKTTDAGENWAPVTDGQITSASVGAVAVSESNPDLVFIGMGESAIRGNIMPGDGIYRSTRRRQDVDARRLQQSRRASRRSASTPPTPTSSSPRSSASTACPATSAASSRAPTAAQTWRKVLFRDDKTGAHRHLHRPQQPRRDLRVALGGVPQGVPDVVRRPRQRPVQEHRRRRDLDGDHAQPGLPARGLVGRIGVAVSRANSEPRVRAGGERQRRPLQERRRRRHLEAGERRPLHPAARVLLHPRLRRPEGRRTSSTWRTRRSSAPPTAARRSRRCGGTHGDFHDLWIDPGRPRRTWWWRTTAAARCPRTPAARWTDQDYPTPQFYHVVTTTHIPFHVCGAQQDNSTLCIPFDWNRVLRRLRRAVATDAASARDITAGRDGVRVRRRAAASRATSRPIRNDLELFYSGTNNGGYLDKYNRATGPAPRGEPVSLVLLGRAVQGHQGALAVDVPDHLLAGGPKTLYVSSQRLWSTTDGGKTWNGALRRPDPPRPEDAAGVRRADHERHERSRGVRHDLLGRRRARRT